MTSKDAGPLSAVRTDDPDVLAAARVDDFAGHVVPRSWRSSRTSLSMAWLSIFSAMFWLVFPASLSLAVGTVDVLIGMVLAAVVISAVAGVLSPFATRSGLTLTMYSQQLMGRRAGLLISLVVGVTAIYYCSFEASVIAVAFHTYVGGPGLPVWYAVTAAMGALLAVGGVRAWLDKFNGVLLPVYVVGVIAAVIWATVQFGYSSEWITTTPSGPDLVSGPGWVLAFSGYLSQLVFVMFLWDFARMGQPRDASFHARVTFGLPTWLATFVLNGIAGIYLANTIAVRGQLSDVSVVLALISLMGLLGLVLIWVTQSRIQTTNFYVASLNLQSFFGSALGARLSRALWVVPVGIVVYVLMLTDVISYLLTALNYQTVLVAGWIAVALTHIVLLRRAGVDDALTEFRPGRLRSVVPTAFGAWAGSAVVGIVLLATTDSFGSTWSVPIVIVVAALLYGALSRALPERVSTSPDDPRDRVDDPWQDRVRCCRCSRAYLAVEMDADPTRGGEPICAPCAARSGDYLRSVGERRS